jgi:hypothetical protein
MFISNGDFIFPFDAVYYWLKHLFVWSFQTGAANLDGIIRLPGRLIYAVGFQLFGNIGVSYFFLITSLLIIFFAFYYFAGSFLKIEKRSTRIILSLLFTLNPIFLGYLAKLGLLVAVAMLPLCLAFLYRGFTQHRFRYFVLYLFALNISLIHPFTFTINLLASGGYAVYLAWTHWEFVRHHLKSFAAIAAVAVLMNLYFILPIMHLGTISKTALSQDISDVPIDYTSLVDIANTGDIFTALSLSKNVLVDFAYYTDGYYIVYFAAVFLLYALLLVLYLRTYRQLRRGEHTQFLIWMAAFLVLTALSTASFFYLDTVIKFLISLPGGWLFRSPLKWQLYIPLALVVLLGLLLRHIRARSMLWTANAVLITVIVFANAVLVTEIATKLLVPRTVSQFEQLQKTNMQQQNLLFVASDQCGVFARKHSAVMTELNQVLISKDVQIKRAALGDIDRVNLGNYAYVMSCATEPEHMRSGLGSFRELHRFADDTFRLYANTSPRPHIYAMDTVYAIDTSQPMSSVADFSRQLLGKKLDYVNEQDANTQMAAMNDVFSGVTARDVSSDKITATVRATSAGENREIIVRGKKDPLYYQVQTGDRRITFSPVQAPGFTKLEMQNGFGRIPIRINQGDAVVFEYWDEKFDYSNMLQNPSFERGPWRSAVNDCNAYDDQPQIGMKMDSQQKTDGQISLQLQARRHTACTRLMQGIALEPGAAYMLSFDYRQAGQHQAGYYIGFDEATSPLNKKLAGSDGQWHALHTIIPAPDYPDNMDLILYAYPNEQKNIPAMVNYDNFKLVKVPDIQNSVYMVESPSQSLKAPREAHYDFVNPTQKNIMIKGASTPFYLAMNDSFHPRWQLGLRGGGAIDQKNHFRLSGTMNGWYVEPALLCQNVQQACVRNADGSYDMQLTAEFATQRWFVIGGVISGVTIVGCIIYVWLDSRKHRGPA